MKINEFLKKQDELWKNYDEARTSHPKPIKAKNARKGGTERSHNIGSKPECKHCKAIIDSVSAINKYDKENLGMTRVEMMNTRNVVDFMRRVIKMMQEGGEL
jgi:arginyl-tRNA--protein-N-Asp/Glu arginylyltransferase